MKRFAFVFIMMALLVAGCSSAGYYGNVNPEHIPIAEEQKEGSIGTIQFSVEQFYITVDGFSAGGAQAVSNISYKDKNGLSLQDAWKEALLSSIAETRLFNNSDDIKYDIKIVIMEIIVPKGIVTSPVIIKANYKILNMDRLILAKTINSTGESDKQLFDGSKRIRSAYQNAVRINIELFLEELLKNSNKF